MRSKALLLSLFLALGLIASLPLQAQEGDREAGIAAVITQQFQDFQGDDFAAAFDHASPMIQGILGSAENFGTMVRNAYPMVWRPGEYRFLDLREEDGRLKQRVEVVDSKGEVFHLDYEMIQTADGWKINGVSVVKTPGLAV